jgi:hypothetical protein
MLFDRQKFVLAVESFGKILGTGSKDINVADIDLTDVPLTVSPTR